MIQRSYVNKKTSPIRVANKARQLRFLQNDPKAYGGLLLNTRKGRMGPRPLATKSTMHLVLRSSKAKGEMSFRTKKNHRAIKGFTKKFAERFNVHVLSYANVGNHLHYHIRLRKRQSYRPFIRALTAAIAMSVAAKNRWTNSKDRVRVRFWDYRPFTRIVAGHQAFLRMRNYILINQMEGFGIDRIQARLILSWKETG